MPTIKTLLSFRDNLEKKQRLVGEVFEVTDERAVQIFEALPDYVEIVFLDYDYPIEQIEVNDLEVIEPITVKSKGRPKTKKA